MSRFARVESGIVTSTISSEQSPTAVPGGVWVDVTLQPAVQCFWLYDGSVFSPPVKVNTRIRADALWDRLAGVENLDTDIACQHNPAVSQAEQRKAARRRLFRREVDTLGYTRLAANKTQNFFNTLEADGIIGVGRAAAILTTPITDAESFD